MKKNLENLPKKELDALDGFSALEVFAYLESKGFKPTWVSYEEGYDPDPYVEDDYGHKWLFGCDEDGNFVMIETLEYEDD